MIKVRETPPPAPELHFPLKWTYRAVLEAGNAQAFQQLNAVLAEFGFAERFVEGRASSGGKYRSFQVTVTVKDKPQMDTLGDRLAAVPGVKFLL